MRAPSSTPRFDREYGEALATREFSADDFERLVYVLCKHDRLPLEELHRYQEHALEDEYWGYLESHLSGDIVVIYKKFSDEVRFARIGRHHQLFRHRKVRKKGLKQASSSGPTENTLTKASRALKHWWQRRR